MTPNVITTGISITFAFIILMTGCGTTRYTDTAEYKEKQAAEQAAEKAKKDTEAAEDRVWLAKNPAPTFTEVFRLAAETFIKSHLRDAVSARIQWLSETPTAGRVSGENCYVYYLKVNSKNGFGAYTGFRPYGVRIVKSDNRLGWQIHRDLLY